MLELVQSAQVGDAGDVRAFACGQLHWQRFDHGLVGHFVDDDGGAGVLRLEALGQVLRDLAFVAVGITLHAKLRAEGHGGGNRRRNGG